MELNITRFFNEACPKDYSASQAEIGEGAGRVTWRVACEDSADFMILDNEEKREAFRDYVRDFGAWSDEEIAAWSDEELNALCIQMVSAEIREFKELADGDWQEWKALSEAGTVSGRLFEGTDGEVYYYVGD